MEKLYCEHEIEKGKIQKEMENAYNAGKAINLKPGGNSDPDDGDTNNSCGEKQKSAIGLASSP
eukprot:3799289-Ditylum_brightwellii.AAC.1